MLNKGFKIIFLSIIAGIFVWIIDAVLDFLFLISASSLDISILYTYHKTFLDMLIFDVQPQKLYLRTIIFTVFIIFGISISTYYSQFLKEKALRMFEERGRDIADRSFNIMHVGKNVEGAISHVSPAIKKVIGYSPEDVVGKPFQSLLPNSEVSKIDEIFGNALKGKTTPSYNTKLFRKNGSQASVQINAFPIIIEGKIVGFIGSISDVTQIKRMEEEIKNLAKFPSEDPDPVLRLDRKGFVLYANKRGQEFLSQWGCQTGEQAPRFVKDLVDEALYRQSSRNIEVELYDKVYSFFITPIVDANYVNLYGRDVTGRKKMEEKLKEYSEQLEEKVVERTRELKEAQKRLLKIERMAAIGETAGMVGHDLRNPLQVLVNTLYLGEKKVGTLPLPMKKMADKIGIRKIFGTINEQVDYMNKIVSDLQDYSRPVKLKITETSLRKLFDETLSTITVPENVDLYININDNFPNISIDPNLMKRVFINLVMNALQAMPNGGKLVIGANQTGGNISISFQDTGVGIPEDNFKNLFQPLRTTKAKGTGFGLSVCKRLVEAHSGSINVESKVDHGSTFIVNIPYEMKAVSEVS